MSRIFEDSLVNNRQFLVFPRWNPTPRRELTLWEIPGVSGCGKIPPVGNWRQSVIELALLPLHSFGQKQGKYINSRWLVRVYRFYLKNSTWKLFWRNPLYMERNWLLIYGKVATLVDRTALLAVLKPSLWTC